MGGGGNTILTSVDGLAWTAVGITGGFTVKGIDISWNGSRWVAVGQGTGPTPNTILTSVDGFNWSTVTGTQFKLYGNSVTWNGTRWVAVGYDQLVGGNIILTSVDGLNWSNVGITGTSFYQVGNGVASNNIWKNTSTTLFERINSLATIVSKQTGLLI